MRDRKIHGESNMWRITQRQERSSDLMFLLGLIS